MTSKVNSIIAHFPQHVRNRYVFVADALFVVVSVGLSFALRLELWLPPEMRGAMAAYLALALLVRLGTLTAMGVHTRYWLYANVNDLLQLGYAVSVSTLVVTVLVLGILVPSGVWAGAPRSVLIIDWFVYLLLVGGSRFLLYEMGVLSHRAKGEHTGQRICALIAGAGTAGMMVAREVANNPGRGLDIIGFVDDDPAKLRVQVNGLRVLGTCDDLPWLILKHKVAQVIITMPSASGSTIRRVRECCLQVGVSVRTMPGLYDIISGKVGLQQIREVQIEDLLRRAPVETDVMAVHGYLMGRRVAVTGAGGSIGRELCRQIAQTHPSLLILIGHGENSIFEI
jgi:FlaA1/EpsC-like NDP-sugar epimerase